MRVFSHGSNVNFHQSTKEMFAPDLNRIIQSFKESTESLLFGSIDVTNEALYVFGRLQKIEIDESADFIFLFLISKWKMGSMITSNVPLLIWKLVMKLFLMSSMKRKGTKSGDLRNLLG